MLACGKNLEGETVLFSGYVLIQELSKYKHQAYKIGRNCSSVSVLSTFADSTKLD